MTRLRRPGLDTRVDFTCKFEPRADRAAASRPNTRKQRLHRMRRNRLRIRCSVA